MGIKLEKCNLVIASESIERSNLSVLGLLLPTTVGIAMTGECLSLRVSETSEAIYWF